MPNCRWCGIPIHWDPALKSETGKHIPIENGTGQPHDCPKNLYNTRRGNARGMNAEDTMSISNSITNLEKDISKISKNVLKLITEVQTLQKRIEGQMPLTFGMSAPEPNSDANPSSTSSIQSENDSNADLSS